MSMSKVAREYLLDVSRLIWRQWVGGLPTGIDRVCHAYLAHFGARSQLVIQRGTRRRILTPAQSDDLANIILANGSDFRRRLLQGGAKAIFSREGDQGGHERIYLNVGHTGLDAPDLPRWVGGSAIRAAFMIHDLIPLTHPEHCRAPEFSKHRLRMENALRCASGIIGVSSATVNDLARFASQRDIPLPPTLAALIATQTDRDIVTPKALDRPYFVTVGTIESRKNHILLLQLWKRLAETLGENTPQLVIIGQRGWEAQSAFAMLDRCQALKPHVLELNHCGDDEKFEYLAGARAMLMPSFVEGYGIPVVEALQYGTPVIVSDLPVYREIAGDIPLYLDPCDLSAWQLAVLDYLGGQGDRRRQTEMISRFEPVTWPAHFMQVEDWLRQL